MATTSIPLTCQAVTNAYIKESGRIGPDLYRRGARMSPIIMLQKSTQGEWTDGMGTINSNVTFERAFYQGVAAARTNTSVSDGDSANSCLPNKSTVSFGQTQRTFQLRQYALETDYFCIADVRQDWQFVKNLNATVDTLANVSTWVWKEWFTADYVSHCDQQVVANAASGLVYTAGSAYSTASLPTAKLTQGMLEEIYDNLYREGGEDSFGTDIDTEAPVFPLIISKEASDNLMRNNADLRNDLRYAFMGKGVESPFLPSGMERKKKVFGGYVHYIDPYPRRFIFSGGAYVQVPVWLSSSTTKGNKQELNPSWQAAPYEETIIWHQRVYRSLVPNTMSNPAPGWEFKPINYMGDWSVRNILERTCNPDGNQLFWRAIFQDADEPINPRVGWSLLHARCGRDLHLGSCYTS